MISPLAGADLSIPRCTAGTIADVCRSPTRGRELV